MANSKKEITVILRRPGVKACGGYVAGRQYTLPAEEAQRLINVKGFSEVEK